MIKKHPFPSGTKISTNEEYYKKFHRKVTGVSANPKIARTPKEFTIMKWEVQEGNVIPEHQNQMVLMLSEDLQVLH